MRAAEVGLGDKELVNVLLQGGEVVVELGLKGVDSLKGSLEFFLFGQQALGMSGNVGQRDLAVAEHGVVFGDALGFFDIREGVGFEFLLELVEDGFDREGLVFELGDFLYWGRRWSGYCRSRSSSWSRRGRWSGTSGRLGGVDGCGCGRSPRRSPPS